MSGSQGSARTRPSGNRESLGSSGLGVRAGRGSCSSAGDLRAYEDFQVPLFAQASVASIVSDKLDRGLLESLEGAPRLLFERLCDTANRLDGAPVELEAIGFLTASVYAEAARRNLRYAAASIGVEVRAAGLDSDDDLDSIDPLLLEWLS